MPNRPRKITFGEMHESGVRGMFIDCGDYRRSHHIEMSADPARSRSGCPTLRRVFVGAACG